MQPALHTPPRGRRRQPASWSRFATIAGSVIIVTGLGILGFGGGLWLSFQSLPDVSALERYSPSESTQIFDIKGRLLANIHGEANRSVVKLKDVSPNLITAILAIEDDQFYDHKGVRIDTILRAALANLQEGRAAQGGSTLTQQLVKNIFLSPKKSLNRKLVEASLALEVERKFSKDQILEMYLNQVYWGHNNYGAETASQAYFKKSASQLTLAEGSLMAGLLRAPENYSPFKDLKRCKERQKVVLDRMVELKLVSPETARAAYNEPLNLGSLRRNQLNISYASTLVLRELEAQFGPEILRKGGLQVQTTLDMDLQALAERSVKSSIARLQKENRRASQMALVSLDPRTGYIKALVGGVDFKKSQFNRAVQSRRQPGSSFKPFVYYTAFARGKYTPDSSVVDAPTSFGTYQKYSPRNYDNRYWGAMTIRRAVQFSRNVPAVKVANSVGIRNVIATAKLLGMRANWQPNLAVALGSVDVSPLELAGAYASFANGGFGVKPTTILQVTDRDNNILVRNISEPKLILDPKAVAMTNEVLQAVVSSGTATKAKLAGNRPVAGKTGTTSDFRDSWFVGYVPQMVTVMWIGNDNYQPLSAGTAGGVYVAPLWKSYMDQALKGQPILSFPTLVKPEPTSPPTVPPRPTRRSLVEAETNTEANAEVPRPSPQRERRERTSNLPKDTLKAQPSEEKFIP